MQLLKWLKLDMLRPGKKPSSWITKTWKNLFVGEMRKAYTPHISFSCCCSVMSPRVQWQGRFLSSMWNFKQLKEENPRKKKNICFQEQNEIFYHQTYSLHSVQAFETTTTTATTKNSKTFSHAQLRILTFKPF